MNRTKLAGVRSGDLGSHHCRNCPAPNWLGQAFCLSEASPCRRFSPMVDRKLFKLPFWQDRKPNWPCPTCGSGVLLLHDDAMTVRESAATIKGRKDPEFFYEWAELRFSAMLTCSNSACKESVALVGRGGVDIDYSYDEDGNTVGEYYKIYRAEYFYPHLRMFNAPKAVPIDVTEEIEKSFSVYFADPDAASNHVRKAVEALLTGLKVKRFLVQKGKRRPIDLHTRIKGLPARFSGVRDILLAIKWLGNAGSHAGSEISHDDVLDAYELLEEALSEIYAPRTKRIEKLAKEINRRKGPKKGARRP